MALMDIGPHACTHAHMNSRSFWHENPSSTYAHTLFCLVGESHIINPSHEFGALSCSNNIMRHINFFLSVVDVYILLFYLKVKLIIIKHA